MKTFKYFFLLILLLTVSSCSENVINNADQVITKKANLIWQGDYAVDGCGFFFEIDGKLYKPENENFIGSEFKTSGSTTVELKFVYSEKKVEYTCGFAKPLNVDGIKVISVKKI